MKSLVLDPGHGGKDPGAVGPTGLRESDVVLGICKTIKERLHGAIKVTLTRDDDSYLSLAARSTLANLVGPDLFLSVHMNAANGVATGYEAFTTKGETKADSFATDLLNTYGKAFPQWKMRADMGDGDPDKEASFSVIRRTLAPAALFECQFIDERTMESWFDSQANQDLVAAALTEGILTHLAFQPIAPQPSDPSKQLLRDALAAVDQAGRLLRTALTA